jgi:glycosyltransferase involved in cell wall biosynthesis
MLAPADCDVVHPGVQHSALLAAGLASRGRLRKLFTQLQIGSEPGFPWKQLLTIPPLNRRVARRVTTLLPDSSIARRQQMMEILISVMGRHASSLTTSLSRTARRKFAGRVARETTGDTQYSISTDGAALRLFEVYKETHPHLVRVLDVAHPYPLYARQLLQEDASRWGFHPEKYDDYYVQFVSAEVDDELLLAHRILVASKFTGLSLTRSGVPAEKVQMVPYGVPLHARRFPTAEIPARPLRLLFVGAVSERKGISLLLRAMMRLNTRRVPVTLDLVGHDSMNVLSTIKPPSNTTFHGPLPGAKLDELFRQAHYLVLPSICEGFGRVLIEALGWGAS